MRRAETRIPNTRLTHPGHDAIMVQSTATVSLSAPWQAILETLTFDYQPVVNVHTGRVFGFEALLRSYGEAGFDSIASVFDEAYDEGVLESLDLTLRSKAVACFAAWPNARQSKLFYNIDNRTFSLPQAGVPHTNAIMRGVGLPNSVLYFEISERHHLTDDQLHNGPIRSYRHHGYRVALDDFGSAETSAPITSRASSSGRRTRISVPCRKAARR